MHRSILSILVSLLLSNSYLHAEDSAPQPSPSGQSLLIELIDSMLALDSSIEAQLNAARSYQALLEQQCRTFLIESRTSRAADSPCDSILSRLEKIVPTSPLVVCGNAGFESATCRDTFKALAEVNRDSSLPLSTFEPLIQRLSTASPDREALIEVIQQISDELLQKCRPATIFEAITYPSSGKAASIEFSLATVPACRVALDDLITTDRRNAIALCLRYGILSPPCVALHESFTRMVKESRQRISGINPKGTDNEESELGSF